MRAEQEVEVPGPMLKHADHPLAGPLEFECQVLHIAETGQRLIAYCAAPRLGYRGRLRRPGPPRPAARLGPARRFAMPMRRLSS